MANPRDAKQKDEVNSSVETTSLQERWAVIVLDKKVGGGKIAIDRMWCTVVACAKAQVVISGFLGA